jgi:signal transduction histidine kinase
VIGSALVLAGWPAAATAVMAIVIVRRAHACRLEAVAEACHELRGPLAAVTLGLELDGRRGRLSPARVRAIELELGRAALALDDLEARRHRAREREAQAPVGVRELLADSVEAWSPVASLRGIDLRLRWSGPEAMVAGDRLRLAQAIGNLICNAVEHGGAGVEVSGRLGPNGVRIEVLDHGPGLGAPVAKLVRSSGRAGRHGHGLRLAHTIAIDHGGRLSAVPSDCGARLVLELPARADAA